MQALQHFCEPPLVKASSNSRFTRDRSATARYIDGRFNICESYTKLQSNLFSVTMDWINLAQDRDRLPALVNAFMNLQGP